MARCLLALGSNLGNRDENLNRAVGEVASVLGCQLVARSRWHETIPIGGPAGQSEFLNGALLVETRLAPSELSTSLHNIERHLGRERVVRWDARVIDIDLLLYDQLCVVTPELTVPHPRMSFRRFVLAPACEIAGWMIDPTNGWTLAQLLRHLDLATRQVAVVAATSESAEWLANEVVQALRSLRLKTPISVIASGADSASAKGLELAMLPALTIVWDDPVGSVCQPARGPAAQIVGNDFAAVLSEAMAAIRAAWPELAAGDTK